MIGTVSQFRAFQTPSSVGTTSRTAHFKGNPVQESETTTALNPALKTWLNQFQLEEQALALQLANNTRYFDLDDARNSLQKLHTRLLQEPGVTPDNSYFCALGKYKSGSVLAYLYRQVNYFPFNARMEAQSNGDPYFLEYSELKNLTKLPVSKKNLVIIDDGIVTGQDLGEYFVRMRSQLALFNNIYIVALTATPEGLKKVEEVCNQMNLKCKILFEHPVYSIYDPEHSPFDLETQQRLRALQSKYLKTFPERLEQMQEISTFPVAYTWNAPVRCPSIISHSYPGVWEALYRRYWGQPTTQRGEEKPDRGEKMTQVQFRGIQF